MKSLYKLAVIGLVDANKKNPFWGKSDAMRSINGARQLPAPRHYQVIKNGRIIARLTNPSLHHVAGLATMGYIIRLS